LFIFWLNLGKIIVNLPQSLIGRFWTKVDMYQKLLCIIFVVYSIDVKNVPEIFF